MERFPQWQNIELLREQGYEVLVKDCSLKGKVPVAGVLIQKDGKALFNLGASPEFSIAVERCITELFQGVHFSQMEQLLKPIIINDKDNTVLPFSSEEKRQEYIYLQNLKTGKANVNRQVFDHSEPFRESSLFFESDLTNGAVLKKLLDTALSFDTDILIRDVSFLGFPSFQVYVPGLSEVCNVSIMEFKLKAHDLPRARKILYNLKNSAKDDLKHLITTLENLIDDPFVGRENSFKTLHNLHITEDALLNNLDPENVLVILYYRLGDYHNAKQLWRGIYKKNCQKSITPILLVLLCPISISTGIWNY
jgi:ribosomal protein S12 methylthiotransferase accessory factor